MTSLKRKIESEKIVEKYLRDEVARLGGFHRKVIYQGRDGSPDDWCFFDGGLLLIIECKTTGEKPMDNQTREMNRLMLKGQKVYVVDSKTSVDEVLAQVPRIK